MGLTGVRRWPERASDRDARDVVTVGSVDSCRAADGSEERRRMGAACSICSYDKEGVGYPYSILSEKVAQNLTPTPSSQPSHAVMRWSPMNPSCQSWEGDSLLR